MALVRRILLLSLVSVAGVGLLAPLAARSASPIPVIVEEHLLDTVAQPPTSLVARGSLSTRADTAAPAAAGSETLTPSALPTPGAAPMEATLFSVARPPVASTRQRVVTFDGDTVWDALAQCESGGNWAINTGNGYYGGLQFSYATWHGYGGDEFAEYPHQATREQQIAVAERLHADRGFAPWPSCRSKLGLP